MLLFRLRVRRRSPWMSARLGWWWRRLLFHAAVCLAVHWNWTGGRSGDGGGGGRWSKWEMWDEKGNRVRHHNKLCTHCTKTKCHTLQSYMYHETDMRSRHFQQEWHSQMLCDEVSISITLISKTVYTCLLTMQTYVYVCKYLYMHTSTVYGNFTFINAARYTVPLCPMSHAVKSNQSRLCTFFNVPQTTVEVN